MTPATPDRPAPAPPAIESGYPPLQSSAGPRLTPPVAVIGVGNTLMGDDGIGIVIAEGLQPEALGKGVELVIAGTAGMELVRYFNECELVILVDAVSTQAEPGQIFRFHPDEAGVTGLRSNNIHGMGVGYLLTAARMKGHEPRVVVFGIQIGDVRPNDGQLTPPVAAAAARVRQLIIREIENWRSGQAGFLAKQPGAIGMAGDSAPAILENRADIRDRDHDRAEVRESRSRIVMKRKGV